MVEPYTLPAGGRDVLLALEERLGLSAEELRSALVDALRRAA